MKSLQKYGRDVLNALRRESYDRNSDGSIALFNRSARLGVWWLEGIRGNPESFTRTHNLVPDAAILDILNVYFGATAKHSAWYIAPYSGNVSPAANWTGANFTANATKSPAPRRASRKPRASSSTRRGRCRQGGQPGEPGHVHHRLHHGPSTSMVRACCR
jgi:hypothetical protein